MTILLRVGLIAAGLLVFGYAAEVTDRIDEFITPPPAGGDPSGVGVTQAWYLPYAVWAFGFTLIGLGGNMLRMAFMFSMVAPAMGGGMAGPTAMSPDRLVLMQNALSMARGAAVQAGLTSPPGKEVVRIKCRNCGSLEAENAVYCRKCGQPL